jgi:predicted anti-sigma-YlaC factor YlaD
MSDSSLTCKELVELVTEYLEDALPPTAKAEVEAHLRGCEGCRRYLDQMRTTIAMTGRLTEQDVPPEAEQKLLDVFRDWKHSS